MAPRPLFVAGAGGPLFCLAHQPPGGGAGRGLLVVAPFAEELNKSRRLLALTGAALADAGWCVLLPDLQGTGDSAGLFEDATLPGWYADLDAAEAWIRAQGCELEAVLAVRTGALLAASWLRAATRRSRRLVLWQPVGSGELFLNQFLRLRSMASRLAGADEPVQGLMRRLEAGECVEVGGYALGPALARELRTMQLAANPPAADRVEWLEFSEPARDEPAAASSAVIARWREAGVDVRFRGVAAESFWATQEIAAPAAVVAATAAALTDP
ncbi:MAG: hydrolase 2, exosortase A system-associated [Gammaproteobacteria bacterium]